MRLIDADRLKGYLLEHYIMFDHRLSDIDAQPTVDAEPVVRCKDCRKWCICHKSDDYYCADGERREDGKVL